MFLIVAIFCYESAIIDPPSLIHKKSHMVPFSLKNSWIRLTFEKSPFPLCLSTLTLSFHDITAHPRSAWTSEHSFWCHRCMTIQNGAHTVVIQLCNFDSLQSFEAILHKSLPGISFLKATRSRDLSFLKLMYLTIASTFVTLRKHKTEQWSERKQSGEGVPLMILSELRVIIRSKICPITCVGDFTCWVRHNDSIRSANFRFEAQTCWGEKSRFKSQRMTFPQIQMPEMFGPDVSRTPPLTFASKQAP